MKNVKIFGIIALIAAVAVISCPNGDGGTDSSLSGTITIFQYGSPAGVDSDVYTGTEITAEYTGTETVSYQWKRDNTNVGGNAKLFTPGEPGAYTVTVSASGYKSKTSAPVTVIGNPIPELPGTLTITVNGAGVTAAQTGDTLTAVYSGEETVSFQWFKGEESVTAASSINSAYTPTEPGSYTVKITFGGYLSKTSEPVAVTGTALITITFDQNDGGYTRPTIVIAPGAAIGTLPPAPTRNGFTFVGWYTALSDGTKLTETTTFTATATVYAHWSFSGGTPYIDAETNTLVHENPLMEKGRSFAGSISEEDGAISFTAGAFQYKFPTVTDVTISDYAYFIVRYQLLSASGNGSGVRLRQYNNETTYVGVSNEWPWFSNEQSTGIRFPVSGAGTTGGFSMLYNGGTTTIEVRITSITFYKLPLYTVTFDLSGGEGTAPSPAEIYEGSTLGAQFPAVPTREDHTFIGWKNGEGTVVTANTPIMGNWTVTAQWVLTSELGDEWIELITTTATSAPVYVFDIDEDTLGDYASIIVKIKSDAAVSGRLRAWGVYALTGFTFGAANTRPGMGNTAGDKLLTNGGLDSFSHNGTWVEYTLPLNAITATNQTGATGQLAIAFGVIAPSGGSGQRNYYVKDITLANADKTKSVPALRPDDDQLWGGNGKSAYVTQNGPDVVSRQILPYEED